MDSIYHGMSDEQLGQAIADLEQQADELRAKGLKLDMARGKPSPEQVSLSSFVLDALAADSDLTDEGVDAANYGAPDGLPSARRLAADILDVDPANVVVSGSSSLNLMYDVVANAWVRGIGGNKPWSAQGEVKFLCPSPGYDRHFAVTDHFGITNVPIPMREDGPDMDEVVRLVEGDASVKGIWCVPKYANPTGITYTDEVVRRFASLRPAAPDFRIFWDNAYIVHDLVDDGDTLLNVFDAMDGAGTTDLVYEFASTSKVTFPGSGMAWVTASPADMAELRAGFGIERVCADKICQLMHVRSFADADAIREHMRAHARVLRPRFDLVESKLSEGLGGTGIATWTHPRGGYFVSFDGQPGTAKATVALAAELGVTMTGAGATWPYGNDPQDTNIRIAPSYPSLDELAAALDVFVVAARLACARAERASRAN